MEGNTADHNAAYGQRPLTKIHASKESPRLGTLFRNVMKTTTNSAISKSFVDIAKTTHHFVSIGIETTGVFGPETLSFFKELGCHLRVSSGEPLSFSHLLQQIGVIIQRGNTAAVLDTTPGPWPGAEI